MKKMTVIILAASILITAFMLMSCTKDIENDNVSAPETSDNAPQDSPDVTDEQDAIDIFLPDEEENISAPQVQKLTGKRKLDLSQFEKEPGDYIYSVGYCGENTICVEYYDRECHECKQISIIDLSQDKELAVIDNIGDYSVYLAGPYADLEKYHYDEEGNYVLDDFKRAIIHPDGSYEWVTEDVENYESLTHAVGDHRVYGDFGSIYDFDTQKPIVERYAEGDDIYGFRTLNYYFAFPLDENRFVYRISGYERIPGIGIYDFTTGEAMDIPNSKDKLPLCASDGNIISFEAYWDGCGSWIYVTDPNTLETKELCKIYEADGCDWIDYSVSKDGRFIGVFKKEYCDDVENKLVLVDPKSGEVISILETDKNMFLESPVWTDDYIFFHDRTASCECLIMDVPKD